MNNPHHNKILHLFMGERKNEQKLTEGFEEMDGVQILEVELKAKGN